MLRAVEEDLEGWDAALMRLELRRMFSQEMDAANAFLDIQAGSGGTEAQDWAEMLLRMYLRWGERRGFGTEMIEASPGEVAGIKSATLHVTAITPSAGCAPRPACTAWSGNLLRFGPSPATPRLRGCTCHPRSTTTSRWRFNPADLRIDVYRASGAGGQHVNRTESRAHHHLPTGVVVQCQNDRSQHKNRATAMKQLKARLYDLELKKRREDQQVIEDAKSDIGWGSQIRSYVLDQSRIKDLRTGSRSATRRRCSTATSIDSSSEPEGGSVEVKRRGRAASTDRAGPGCSGDGFARVTQPTLLTSVAVGARLRIRPLVVVAPTDTGQPNEVQSARMGRISLVRLEVGLLRSYDFW